jgi:hypothetical protein
MASPEGSFPMYAEEEVKSPQMCGHGVLTRILRKSPGRSPARRPAQASPLLEENESKSCMGVGSRNSRYTDLAESVHSRDTESFSSSEKSQGDKRVLQGNPDSVLPYTIQFDPNDLKEVMGDQKKDPKTLSRAKQRASGPGFRPSPWSTNLSVVNEEGSVGLSFDDSETKSIKHVLSSGEGVDILVGGDVKKQQQNNDMLTGMRNLILKQQKVLAQLSSENTQYRREIRSYQDVLLQMKENQTSQKDKMDLLTFEKETYEAETVWLREQLKSPERKILQQSHVVQLDPLTQQFQKLMMDPPVHTQLYVEDKEEEENEEEDNEFQKFKKALMSDEIVTNILSDAMGFSDKMREKMVQDRDDEATRARDTRGSDRDGMRSPELSFESRSVYTDTSKGSKEDVALFKTRLETIQQRRKLRQTGRSPTIVRFDAGV